MGCHTRYLVPVVHGIETIKQLAVEYLNRNDSYLHSSSRQMYEYAIANDLYEPIMEMACNNYEQKYTWAGDEEWVLYKEANHVAIEEYNRVHSTNYRVWSQIPEGLGLDWYGDEPRIGGYPERVIRSYEDMVDFMATGYIKGKGTEHPQHINFYYAPERYDLIMAMIRRFFDNHPTGIIVFG